LGVVIVLSFLLKVPIKRASWLFYLLAVAVVVLFLARGVVQLPAVIDQPFFFLMQKATLAEAIFVVVMLIGVFDVKSKIRVWFQPIRAELSIIACIITLGHIAAYLTSFGARILLNTTSYNGFLLSSFIIALVLFALLLVLGFTSFEIIKRHMKTRSWKKIQYLAYAFYFLTYVHILLFLLPPAIGGGVSAQISVVAYSVVFIGYCVLRLRRWRIDSKVIVSEGNSASSAA
jgi:DMSO/TMAO reductase YedYZ heme-binding membrane subunit